MKKKFFSLQIQKVVEKIERSEIILQPSYQRNSIWDYSKKKKLINTIRKNWVVPPITIHRNQSFICAYEVLDGQQRLNAIYEYWKKNIKGKTNFDFEFLEYELSFMEVFDFKSQDIAEYFYRLNDQMSLTKVERRSAYNSNFRNILKSIVNRFEAMGFNYNMLGFSNKRLSYDDIFSRVLIYLEVGEIDINLTSETLDEYFLGNINYSSQNIVILEKAIYEFTKVLNDASFSKVVWKKANVLTWLWYIAERLKYTFNTDYELNTLKEFILKVEKSRIAIKEHNFYETHFFSDVKLEQKLLELFNIYMSKDALLRKGIVMRDIILKIIEINKTGIYNLNINNKLERQMFEIRDRILMYGIANEEISDIENLILNFIYNRRN